MDALINALIDFQSALVSSLVYVTVLGVALTGFGLVTSVIAPVYGYRVKRLGLQVIGSCLIVICAHAILLELYGPNIPPGILIAIYTLFALMLLQGLLNLVFGPAVGNSVVASLLSSFILWVLYVALQPLRLIRDLFRQP